MSLTLRQMAALHARCFSVPRPWSEAEFSAFEISKGIIDLRHNDGFLIGRVVADEAELLTLAVAPEARRKGIGAQLTDGFIAEAAQQGARHLVLEVAAENAGAIALYRSRGFDQTGLRKGYYGGKDALIMARTLNAEKTD
ncbi:MAG: GNAT family N-acetyltransferase [Pseudomonadota bacterium]